MFSILFHISTVWFSTRLLTAYNNWCTYCYVELCKRKQLVINEQRPENFISVQQRYCTCTATTCVQCCDNNSTLNVVRMSTSWQLVSTVYLMEPEPARNIAVAKRLCNNLTPSFIWLAPRSYTFHFITHAFFAQSFSSHKQYMIKVLPLSTFI